MASEPKRPRMRRLVAEGCTVTHIVTIRDQDTQEVLWTGSSEGMRDAVKAIRDKEAAADDPKAPGVVWLLYFEDQEMPPEIFTGAGATEAARARFEQMRSAWSCHLFVRVAHG